jgi:lipopolysaccharide/colanic/teichoic acid biosynthesis glycosyltransferase
MIALDVEYVEGRSFWQNVKIILLTVPTVIHGKGAR